jgi:MoaA/NifB/PqqE/SkfB family radical SAM enzyme
LAALRIEAVKAINIEVSSKCNAGCPFCSRRQKVRPYAGQLITLADFKRLPADLIQRLRRLTFGGNFGDLCCNPDVLEIAAYIRRLNPEIILEGDTNGSSGDPAWWQALGASFQKGAMVFALDGLADTHRRHRRGTDFHKIIENMRAFVSGGGSAQWQFIVFRHNEHQLQAAEELARSIGCRRFYALASRDFSPDLAPPEMIDFRIKREVFTDYRQGLEGCDRQALCRPLVDGTIYIAADGSVHPCCYAHLMYITEHNAKFGFIAPLVEKYHERISFKTRPLAEILQGAYFREVFEKAKTNAYCQTKCNRFRKQIRRQLMIRDRFFDQ